MFHPVDGEVLTRSNEDFIFVRIDEQLGDVSLSTGRGEPQPGTNAAHRSFVLGDLRDREIRSSIDTAGELKEKIAERTEGVHLAQIILA